MSGATIVISPPNMPRITSIEQLLSTSVLRDAVEMQRRAASARGAIQ